MVECSPITEWSTFKFHLVVKFHLVHNLDPQILLLNLTAQYLLNIFFIGITLSYIRAPSELPDVGICLLD